MKRLPYIVCIISVLILAGINQIHALPAIQRGAIATITEDISFSGGVYTYTYILNNTDPSGIWWWGMWFTSDPVAVNESNNRAKWAFNGNGTGAITPFQYESGPSGEAGLIWTFDIEFGSSGGGWVNVPSPNRIPSGETDIFSFQSNILFPGVKNFFYDTVNYYDALRSVEAVGQTSSAAAVPEPATMLLLGSGLIGLAGYGRKKFFKK